MPRLHMRGPSSRPGAVAGVEGWLTRLLGEWVYEVETRPGGDRPSWRAVGAESVRPLGEFWILSEGDAELPDGNSGATILTLAYDPRRERFAGTWTGPYPAEPFVLGGALDPEGEVLTLHAGPSPSARDPQPTGYRTELEFEDEDRLRITAWRLNGAGGGAPIVVARLHRWG